MRAALLRFRLSWPSLLPILCICLVLMSGVVQVAHFHVFGQPDHECALCVATHHVACAAPEIALPVDARGVASLLSERNIDRPRQPVFFRLTGRAPPAAS